MIDECHRGSAAEDSAWREILDYFSGATQIGLTATPKETEYVSNIALFRRAGLHLFAEAGHPRRLPRALQGHQGPYRPRRGRLSPGEGPARPRGRGGRGPHLQHQGFRPHAGAGRPHQARREEGHRVPEGKRRPLPEDHRLLRRSGARGADAAGARQRKRRSRAPRTSAMSCASPAATRKARTTRQLHRPGIEISRARHHLAPALDRCRCADLPPDRARPRGRLDDRVQADRRARHPRARGHQEVLLHPDRLPRRDQPFRRPGFRRRAGADLRAGRRRSRSRRPTTRRRPARMASRCPTTPGADETIVDQPDLPLPPRRRAAKKVYVDGVGATHPRRARRISRRERQARHRMPARLHQEGAEEALRQPRRFPQALESRPSASRRSSRNWKPRACRSTPIAEELGKNLDPFDLICHVAFDKKPLTRRERAENVKKRDVFTKYGAAGPRRARRAARKSIATRACSISTTPTC